MNTNNVESPSVIDLIKGAFGIRVLRKYRSLLNLPDMVFVSENLAFGGFTSYSKLEKKGITTILDLRAETLEEKIDNEKLKYKKIRILDSGIPTYTEIYEIVNWIKDSIDLDEKVFVHCNLGRGRASLVIAIYSIYEGKSLQSALNIIKKRRFTYLNQKQLNFLKNYYERRKNENGQNL